MRLSVIPRIIKAEVGVIDNANRGLDNSRYHAKTEFNNYFIIHIRFIPTSYKFNYFDKMLELLHLIFQKCFRCCWRQHIIPQVAQAHEWLLVCLVFAHDFENKFYFKYT